MCGLAGIITAQPHGVNLPVLKAMAGSLAHRGPDGEGFWVNHDGNVGLAHRRLSVLDLSTAARQPLQYQDYSLVYNGEIYNYPELKEELRQSGYSFSSTGDSEVIPAAYHKWGIDFLHRLDGMFAFALYHSASGELLLARDRFGEKPLFYSATETAGGKFSRFHFASEMKALWAAEVPRRPNHGMLLNYMTLGQLQNAANKAETFLEGIYSLPPGHFLRIDTLQHTKKVEAWYLPGERIAGRSNKDIDEKSAKEKLQDLFFTAVRRRLRSDVAVGTSLSGGLDSSCIVAVIARLKHQLELPATWSNLSFTAGFPGFERDETAYAKTMADFAGIANFTITPTADDAAAQWQQLMHHQEEPLQSSSVFVQYAIYQLAKQHGVTVLLDGQGADEILAGYSVYSKWYLQQLLRTNKALFRHEKLRLQQHGMLPQWGLKNWGAAWFPEMAARRLEKKTAAARLHYPHLNSAYVHEYCDEKSLARPAIRLLEDALYRDTFGGGLETLLRYADRNSMAHGCEVRLPFLSHELVEFIFSLPSGFKIKDGFGKWILRQTMAPFLPPKICWRTDKIGYEPPQAQWFQQPSMTGLIMDARQKLVREGILNAGIMATKVHSAGAHAPDNFDFRIACASAMF